MTGTVLTVAVIGAGVSGLLTARNLQREGQHVVVYEKSDKIGGTWVYNPEVEDDPLGLNPNRKIVHSSLYNSLRANLPVQLMEFIDYPSGDNGYGGGKNQQLYFPGRQEVSEYLEGFVRRFGIDEFVEFNTQVIRVEKRGDKWVVESRTTGISGGDHEVHSDQRLFDAVVVCNGHNTKPRPAHVSGIEKWHGKQIHSHNYRVPEVYRDQIIVVIGSGPSAYDIAFDISTVAKEVHLSARNPHIEAGKHETFDNVWQHSKVENCYENGEVSFEDGALVATDIILHCTGFEYEFPFLKTDGIVAVDDNRVGPLYKHVFPPKLAPTLSFVGIPKQTANFRMMELQAKWVARVLSGKVVLPSEEEMLADVELHYRSMDENGVPKHHTHTLPPGYNAYVYLDWLASQVGLPPANEEEKLLTQELVEWRVKMKNKRRHGKERIRIWGSDHN